MLSHIPPSVLHTMANRISADGLSHQSPKAKPKSPQTVMLVDDDEVLREVMEACLGIMGYAVVPCCDAHAASRTFQSANVDFLLTDLQMPGKSGLELARELTQLRPTLPVMILSGSTLTEELTAEIEQRRWKFMSKPCSMVQLVGTMQTLLSPGTNAQTW